MLADLAAAGKAVLGEELDGSAEQESPLRLAAAVTSIMASTRPPPAVLAPSLSRSVLIEHERSVGAAGAHAIFFDGESSKGLQPGKAMTSSTRATKSA